MRFSTLLLLAGLGLAAQPAAASGPPPTRPTVTAVRKHLIYFRDKAGSPFSPSQPQAFLSARSVQRRTRQNIAVLPRDLPVNPAYVAQVKAVAGTQVWYTSRWFNAAVVACDDNTLQLLQALPFVRGVETLSRPATARPLDPPPVLLPTDPRPAAPADYGIAYGQANMIGAVTMHSANFRGEGMQVAVFDGGFPGVDQIPAFAPMRQEQRLGSTFNFVDKIPNVFVRDGHGTNCLSTMAASQPGVFIGTAPKATYHLFITEDVSPESPVEEMNWLVAAEYADSVGVDIISSSLGYSTFDDPTKNYTYADLNGRTAICTRAAVVAARVGMLVVNSAGNEGNGSWRYITTPADADSVLTVGSVDSQQRRSGFSSVGPTADGRLKPNVVAQGTQAAIITPSGAVSRGNGTSFSCPVMAGMAAGFWQANRTLTVQQVIGFLQRAGSQATAPDNLLGYGVPNFVQAYTLANPGVPLAAGAARPDAEEIAVYPNPSRTDELYVQLPPDFQGRALSITVLDARGTVVARQQLPATTAAQARLQPGPLAKGVYTCTISSSKTQRTVRFIKL